MKTDTPNVEAPKVGAFISSLKRNNRQIREDRAEAIADDAKLIYRRKVEDIEIQIKKLEREQENALDLSPKDANSLTLANDFNSINFMDRDIAYGLKMRELKITLEIAKARYEYLFGGE